MKFIFFLHPFFTLPCKGRYLIVVKILLSPFEIVFLSENSIFVSTKVARMKNIVKYLIIFITPFLMGSCFVLIHDDCYDGDDCNEELYLPVEAVDLGLSVAWASSNVGAKDLLGHGDYFAWGDTIVKEEYVKENYSNRYKKDIASSKLGGNWRMPTIDEVNELIDRCKVVWVSKENVEGVEFKARNGNSIFFPKTGYKELQDIFADDIPMIWIYATCNATEAYSLALKNSADDEVEVLINCKERYIGIPVRAVWAY